MNVDFIPPRSRCEFVVPGNEIPEWVNHKSVGSPSVSAELDPGWLTDHKWIGFSLCVVFAVPEHQLYGSEEDLDNFLCKLSINGEVGTPSVNYALESLLPDMSNHLWLCYLPPHECYFYFWCENIYSNIEASFGFIGSTVEVIECGFHLVYEEDFEVLVKKT
ncbi:unnamed protein product [Prunus armeniaca]